MSDCSKYLEKINYHFTVPDSPPFTWIFYGDSITHCAVLFGSCGGDVGKVVGAAGCCEERQKKDGGFSHFIISNIRSRTSSIEPVPSTSR